MTDVNHASESEEAVSEDLTTQEEEVVEESQEETTATPSEPGSKTDPALLLKALKDEREEKKRLKEELDTYKSSQSTEDVFSDEGKAILERYVAPLSQTVKSLEETIAMKDLIIQYPAIKDKLSEFDEFRKDYPSARLDSIAKLFLAENGLLETPKRKGLEKVSGGGRTAPVGDMSTADIENLRKTDYKSYSKKLKEGKIKV